MYKYIIKDFTHFIQDKDDSDMAIGEISEKAFSLHLKLYEGYVNNTNLISEKIAGLDTNSPEWNELHRRFGWEWNGMRNHELFFDSLQVDQNNDEATPAFEKFKKEAAKTWGEFDIWKKDFEALCKVRGIGWAMLVQDRVTKKLINTWVNEHDTGMLSDVNIILNFDMFEHAYISDFGTDRQKYLESIWNHINWTKVADRFA